VREALREIDEDVARGRALLCTLQRQPAIEQVLRGVGPSRIGREEETVVLGGFLPPLLEELALSSGSQLADRERVLVGHDARLRCDDERRLRAWRSRR
jgi:hypothetical protein